MHLAFGFTAGIVTIRFAGEYLIADAKTAIRMVLPGGKYAVRGTLIDLRESQSVPRRSQADLESIGTYLADLRDDLGGRVAVVVGGQLAYGLSRVAAAWAGVNGLPMRAFLDETSAVAWLIDSQSPDAA